MLVGEYFGFREKEPIEETSELLKSKTYVGVELEFSEWGGVVDKTAAYYWRVVGDGSIRGDHPAEFVSRNPATPQVFAAAITYLRDIISECKVNDSCGLHVHVDVCDLTFDELRGVLLLYSALERTLYKYCGAGREDNNFCVPLSKCGDRLSWFGRGGVVKIDNALRYCGLNLAAVRKFGSLEFRMHKGTTDLEEVVRWVNICTKIKDYGRSSDVESLYKLIMFSEGARPVLDKIFGKFSEFLPADYVTVHDLHKGLLEGKEIYYAPALVATNKRKSRGDLSNSPFAIWLSKQEIDQPPLESEIVVENMGSSTTTTANYRAQYTLQESN